MIKFLFLNTFYTTKKFIQDIFGFIWGLIQPLVYPWMSAYIAILYYEIIFLYYEKCKYNKLPYLDPQPAQLASAAYGLKYSSTEDTIFYNLHGRHNKFLFRLILTPYNLAAYGKQHVKEILSEAAEYNKQFNLKPSNMDDSDKNKIIESEQLYKTLFGLG